MDKGLVQSMREAVAYVKGDKSQGFETKIRVFDPVEIPERFDVQSLRKDLQMSQAEFACRFGFNVNTLKNWEHGRRKPDRAVLAYLCVIAKNHELVEHSLRS